MVQFLAMMTGGGGGIGRANKACQVAVVLFLGCIALAWTLSMLWSEPLVGTTQLRQKGRKGGSGSGYPAAAERGRVVTNTNQAFLDESLRQEALDFVLSRQKAYNDSGIGVNWKLRGNGYLYTHKKLVLAAQVPPGGKSVHIYDVLSALNGTSAARTPRDDCEKLTMWVRVYGPEIYAGSAEAVPATETSDCFWKYDFEVRGTRVKRVHPSSLELAPRFVGPLTVDTTLNFALPVFSHRPFPGFTPWMPKFSCGTPKIETTKPSKRARPRASEASCPGTFWTNCTPRTLVSRGSSCTIPRSPVVRCVRNASDL
jgi:hypothetical protein